MTKCAMSLELPCFPVAVWNLLREISSKTASMATIAATLQDDPALSAKILSVANSPYYRSSRKIETMGHAVSWLGTEATASIALSVSLASLRDERAAFQVGYKSFWIQSFIRGIALEQLAYSLKICNTNKAYLLGLLMGVGKVAQLSYDPLAFNALESDVRLSSDARKQREQELFTADYVQIGTQILKNMSMPADFVNIVANHVKTQEEIAALPDRRTMQMASAARIACEITKFLCQGTRISSLLMTRQLGREVLGMSDALLDKNIESIERNANEKAEAFNVNLSHMPSISQLFGETSERLTQLLIDKTVLSCEPDLEASTLREKCEELRRQLVNVEHRTCRDSLTGAFNRDYFEGRIRERIRQSRVNGDHLSVLLIDLDRFKQINDVYGHLAGDVALKAVAAAISSECGADAVFCRYGGDEFIVLLDINSEQELIEIAKQIIKAVSGIEIKLDEEKCFGVALSIGGVVAHPLASECKTVAQIVQEADSAMYKSKRLGGNRIEIACWPERSKTEPFVQFKSNTMPEPVNV